LLYVLHPLGLFEWNRPSLERVCATRCALHSSVIDESRVLRSRATKFSRKHVNIVIFTQIEIQAGMIDVHDHPVFVASFNVDLYRDLLSTVGIDRAAHLVVALAGELKPAQVFPRLV